MTLTIFQRRPFDAQVWNGVCGDAQQLISASACLTCGPDLGPVFIDPVPAAEGLGLHLDRWDAPGHPLLFWPFEPLPYVQAVALVPGSPGSKARAYAELFLCIALRTAHLTGALDIHLASVLTPAATAARRTVSAGFTDQRPVNTGSLGPQ